MRIYILSVLLCCLSCTSSNSDPSDTTDINKATPLKFESTKWKMRVDNDYPYRDRMLNDLIASKILKGMKREYVLDLLGRPTRVDTNYLFYRVAQKRLGFFPLHTKTLVIQLSGDTLVKTVRIHE